MKCRWVIREGTNNSYWAFTPCKRGFNPLTKISRSEEIKDAYNGRLCPICGNPIKCNMELIGG